MAEVVTIRTWHNYVEKIRRKLSKFDDQRIDRRLKLLVELGAEHFLKIKEVVLITFKGCKFYEFRIFPYRIIFVERKQIYWLLHIFSKKKDKTKKWEFETVLGRVRDLDMYLLN